MRAGAVLLGLLSAVAAAGSHADGWVQVHWENDVFLHGRSTDRWYTNGTRLSWATSFDPAFDVEASLRKWLLGGWSRLGGEYVDPYATIVGQQMYTPQRIDLAEEQPLDRPWAGWLYAGRRYEASQELLRWGGNRFVHRAAELSVGILGPSARAAQAQTWLHRQIDSTPPHGWHNQLGDRATINLHWVETTKMGGQAVDFLPHWGFTAGNVQMTASAGTTIRVGQNLVDFPSRPSAPTAPARPTGATAAAPDQRVTWYLAAGFEARAVAYNTFLQDRNRKWLVLDGILLATYRSPRWAVSYMVVRRSAEFRSPTAGPHTFGAVVITVPL